MFGDRSRKGVDLFIKVADARNVVILIRLQRDAVLHHTMYYIIVSQSWDSSLGLLMLYYCSVLQESKGGESPDLAFDVERAEDLSISG